MIYIIKTKDNNISDPTEAKNLTVEEGILMIEHIDDSLGWIPLLNIESVKIGTRQPWTKARKDKV